MSEEKINLISVKLYTEYYKNNIKDRYIRNYSDNAVIDNDVLKADYLEYVYITTLDKHNKLQQENQELKKQLEEKQNPLKGIFSQVNDDMLLRNCGAMQSEIDKYKTQQKEFINWLIESESLDDYCNETTFTYIREKYEEIIGDKK